MVMLYPDMSDTDSYIEFKSLNWIRLNQLDKIGSKLVVKITLVMLYSDMSDNFCWVQKFKLDPIGLTWIKMDRIGSK